MYKQFTLALLAAVATADEGDFVGGPIYGTDWLDHQTEESVMRFPGGDVELLTNVVPLFVDNIHHTEIGPNGNTVEKYGGELSVLTAWDSGSPIDEFSTYYLIINYRLQGDTPLNTIGMNVLTKDADSSEFEEWGFRQRDGLWYEDYNICENATFSEVLNNEKACEGETFEKRESSRFAWSDLGDGTNFPSFDAGKEYADSVYEFGWAFDLVNSSYRT